MISISSISLKKILFHVYGQPMCVKSKGKFLDTPFPPAKPFMCRRLLPNNAVYKPLKIEIFCRPQINPLPHNAAF